MRYSYDTLFIISQAVTVLASPAYRCGGVPCTAGDFVLAVRNSDPFKTLATDEQWNRFERYSTSPAVKRFVAEDPQAAQHDGQRIDGAQFNSIHASNLPHTPPSPGHDASARSHPQPPPEDTHRSKRKSIRDGQFQSAQGPSHPPPPTQLDRHHRDGSAFQSITDPETTFRPDLQATDLRTDLGVAVLGTSRSTGKQTRHLAHLPAVRNAGDAWTGFLREVRVRDLQDVKVVVRMPDLGADLPARAHGAPWDWSEGDAALAKMVRSEVQILVRANLGVAPRVVASPMGAVYRGEEGAGTMEVSGRGGEGARVWVDGKVVA